MDAMEDWDEAELLALFADLPAHPVRGQYEGVALEVARDDMRGFITASVVGGAWAGATVEKLRTRPRGVHARLWLPRAAALDLVVRPRKERNTVTFAGSYEVESLVPHLAMRFLGEALPRALTELWPRYYIEVRDAHLDVGPLDGAPAESARVIRTLVRAFDELVRDDRAASDRDEAPEDAVELDAFCFFCGHAVGADVTVCPHCGGDLSED